MKKSFFILIIIVFSINFSHAQNVGIGTTNPDEKLTVVGTIKSNINSNSNFPQILIHEAQSDYGRIKYTNTSSAQYFTLAGNPQQDSTVARFHVFNSDFGNIGSFTGHGRFGINASNPAATLHLSSQSGTDLLRIQNENFTKFRIFSNNAMVFGSNWATPIPNVIRMQTPNLFIGFDGNHIPEERLEVDGIIKASGLKIPFGHQEGYVLTSDIDGNASWTNVNQNQTLTKFINEISISGGNTIAIDIIANSDLSTYVSANTSGINMFLSGQPSFRFARGDNSTHLQFLESNSNIFLTGSEQPSTVVQGTNNVSIGSNAGEMKIGGSENIILGQHGTNDYGGFNNILIGTQAGYLATANGSNISIGRNAGASVDGNNNVSIGISAGFTAGEKSINIGYQSGTGVTGYDNGGSIGSLAVNTADDQFVIGTSLTSEIGGYEPWSNLSDGRFKEGVLENVPGLQFINILRPVTYVLNTANAERFIRGEEGFKNLDKEFKLRLERRKPTKESGFIAQEVEKAAQSLGYDFNGIVAPQNDNDPYAIAYSQFVVPLVKAVQELDEKNKALEKQNEDLETRLARLERLVEKRN